MGQQSDMFVVDRVRSVIHCFSAVLSDGSSEVVVVVWSAAGSAYLDTKKVLPWQLQIFLKHYQWAKQGSRTPTDLSGACLGMLFWCPEDRLETWPATGKEGIVSWTLIHRDLFAFIKKKKGMVGFQYWYVLLVERHSRLGCGLPILLLKLKHKINEVLQLLFLNPCRTGPVDISYTC